MIMALFGLPHIRLVRLLFSARTVFLSHNNSAGTVFFSQFQPSFRPANGAKKVKLHFISMERVQIHTAKLRKLRKPTGHREGKYRNAVQDYKETIVPCQ